MVSRANVFFNDRIHRASARIYGEWHDVGVQADYQPEEYDTNTPDSVEITAVWLEDQGNVIDHVDKASIKELEGEVLALFYEWLAGDER